MRAMEKYNQDYLLKQMEEKRKKSKKRQKMTDEEYRINKKLIKAADAEKAEKENVNANAILK